MIEGHRCGEFYAAEKKRTATKIPKVVKLVASFEWTETEGKKIFCFKLSVTSITEGIRVCALRESVSNSRQSRKSV